MTDIVLTIAQERWTDWLNGFAAADPSGCTRAFFCFERPPVSQGDRLYVVAFERLRCVFEIERLEPAQRGAGFLAIARFIAPVFRPGKIAGFRGWRRRWWELNDETPYPAWRQPYGGEADAVPPCPALAHGKTPSMQGGSSA